MIAAVDPAASGRSHKLLSEGNRAGQGIPKDKPPGRRGLLGGIRDVMVTPNVFRGRLRLAVIAYSTFVYLSCLLSVLAVAYFPV
jgi:hypothetical protein